MKILNLTLASLLLAAPAMAADIRKILEAGPPTG